MDNRATAEIMEAIAASALQLAGVLRGDTNPGDSLAGGVALAALPAGPAQDPAAADLPGLADGPSTDLPTAGASLAGADLLRWQAEACLTVLCGVAGMEAMLAAVKVHVAGGYDHAAQAIAGPATSPAEQTAQDRAIVTEVACALTVSERAADTLLGEALSLTASLPLTMAGLEAGTLSWQHARIMVDETTNLDRAGARALEAHFLDQDAPNPARGCPAGDMIPGRFRHKARTWRERHHPVSIEKRHARCAADRRVDYSPDRDGMAWLSAYLPADTAAGIWDRTTAAARALQGPGEPRTLTQLRADTVAILLLGANPGGAGSGPGVPGAPTADDHLMGDVPSPRAQVLVTVPVFALMGLTDEPAVLDGHGPIPPSMARKLVANGAESFHRVLTDPRDGAPLEIGRDSYRIPQAMRQWLRLRDGKCPFPGCNNQSLDNDADHLLAWANGGTTGITNLAQPCRKHHRLKHTTPWKPTQASKDQPPGWTSPTGRHYPSEQPDWEPPTWPKDLLPENLPEDPFPELNSIHFPLPEDDLPDYVLFPDDSLPGRPLPKDPYPTWSAQGWTKEDWTKEDWTQEDWTPEDRTEMDWMETDWTAQNGPEHDWPVLASAGRTAGL